MAETLSQEERADFGRKSVWEAGENSLLRGRAVTAVTPASRPDVQANWGGQEGAGLDVDVAHGGGRTVPGTPAKNTHRDVRDTRHRTNDACHKCVLCDRHSVAVTSELPVREP